MRPIIPFISIALLLIGCAGIDTGHEGKAIILDHQSVHTIIAVDGMEPTRSTHSFHTVIPNVVVSPGTYEFTILYSMEANPVLAGGNSKEKTLTATLKEGFYIIEDNNGHLSLKPTNTP